MSRAHDPTRPKPRWTLVISLSLALVTLAGCHQPDSDDEGSQLSYIDMGFNGTTWPPLDGRTLTIIDHGAFSAFDSAVAAFRELTGAEVIQVAAADTGTMLNRAVLEKGDPSFDVLYGLDNILLAEAIAQEILEPYRPLLAERIAPEYLFFDPADGWYATPVDFGYIGLNVDRDHPDLANAAIVDLLDVRHNADTFVTSDPRTSTPGLGFLLATIATFGEPGPDNPYSWQDYWNDLFEGGLLVTADWSTAYMSHFSAAGEWVGPSARDKAIVTSYSESPAYESFSGMPPEDIAEPIVVQQSTFHQIQTMAIARGTDDPAVAEAWIEFTLTDAFQVLAAPQNAVYPVVNSTAAATSVADTYGNLDPMPGSFTPADIDYQTIGANVERWTREWVARCEAHDCA